VVQQELPQARLTIVGAKPDLQLPGCEVTGKLPPEELDKYYQEASVFCLPTYREPFGVVFIEAMAAHLPIVATRVGAIPDFVEEGRNGFTVEPGDIQALAEALLQLLKNPELCRSFGEHSFRLTRDRYSWKVVGKSIRKYIYEALGETDPAGQSDLSTVQELR
jgi:glycosyltransferase involved in cell wall biosynthesis